MFLGIVIVPVMFHSHLLIFIIAKVKIRPDSTMHDYSRRNAAGKRKKAALATAVASQRLVEVPSEHGHRDGRGAHGAYWVSSCSIPG